MLRRFKDGESKLCFDAVQCFIAAGSLQCSAVRGLRMPPAPGRLVRLSRSDAIHQEAETAIKTPNRK